MNWRKTTWSLVSALLAFSVGVWPEGEPTADPWEDLMRQAARHYGEGNLPDSRDSAVQALKLEQDTDKGINLRAAESHYLLGEILTALTRHEDAIHHARRGLLIRSKLLGVDHVQVGFSANSLAQAYQDQGNYQKALPLNEQAIAIWRVHFGKDHPHLAVPYNNQGRILNIIGKHHEKKADEHKNQGRTDEASRSQDLAKESYRQAMTYFREAELILKSLPGDGSLTLGACYQNMADTQLALGQLEEAEVLYRQALKILGKELGRKEPFVILCISSLAHITNKLGKNDEAETLYRQALKYTIEHLGDDEHMYRLLTDMGAFYEKIGKIEKSIDCRAYATLIKEGLDE
jgi:tetratricopeptide (TPR) repeat protein